MALEFYELEYHGKLEFLKIEFSISGSSLHISEIMVDCKIFSKTVVFGHFGPQTFHFPLTQNSSTIPLPPTFSHPTTTPTNVPGLRSPITMPVTDQDYFLSKFIINRKFEKVVKHMFS